MIEPPLPALFALPLWNVFGDFGPVFGSILIDKCLNELILFFSPGFFVSFGLGVVGFGEDLGGDGDVTSFLEGCIEIHVKGKVTVIINLMS